jgi:ABC-type glycerol-3-phosphate transport system permease component
VAAGEPELEADPLTPPDLALGERLGVNRPLGAPSRKRAPRELAWGQQRRSSRVLSYLALLLFLCFFIGPLVWVLLSSLKLDSQILAYPPTFLPNPWTPIQFINLYTQSGFGGYLWHSAAIGAVTTCGVIVFGVLGAYAIVRFRTFRVVTWVGSVSVFVYMIPGILLLVPLTTLMYHLNLTDNLLSVMVVYTVTLLPFALWTLRSYFQGVSIELEYAAMVDGCTRFGAFRRVVLPQAVPGIIAVGIFAFNGAWSEYLFASVLLTTPDVMTVSQGVLQLEPSAGIPLYGQLMAAAISVVAVPLLLYTFFQRFLVATWGAGSLKG